MSSHAHNRTVAAAQEPARKRLATEAGKGHRYPATPTSHHTQDSSAADARARFLRELEQYASDDEDEVVAVSRSRGDGVAASPVLSVPNQIASTLLNISSAPPPSPASSASVDNSDFFFGHATQLTNRVDRDDADGHANSTADNNGGALQQRNGASAAGSARAASRIGLSLLHRMHAETTPASTERGTTRKPDTSKGPEARGPSSAAFEVVHAYAPLSTGGFLSTATAGDDLMEGRQVRVGDVLSLRQRRGATSLSSQASSTLLAGRTGSVHTPVSPQANTAPPLLPPSSSPVPSSPLTARISADAAQEALHHFKPAASFTDGERGYGMQLPPDMVRQLLEVTRVDPHGRSVEALFLDGTREKLPFRDVRPAGYDEQRRYAQWKADPSSRPVATMHSGASSPTSASAPGTHPASPVAQTSATAQQANSTVVAAADTWWVIPHLLVRVATEVAGDWYGKKCAVTAVRRSENAIRLTEWHDEAQSSGGHSSHRNAAETRELIGADGLETVVPKKGGRAVIVLGPRKGEICTVRSRVRGPMGDLTGVEVEIRRTNEVVTLQAEELCALAR
ncbi:hypothetical protein ABB37_05623 [Leptomonas pyrrhocoris]|uniref:KOW domain-containing protein n=1 Tax=Leptomonas pyrrhocoris TaxID=157538 RepID=A0A0N0DUU9_LEPPY|nr:hypothetical protein ABB37_05623 [Leptomonas pyrrhocoris]XP_015657543.1 hypothetical protein ABB37_05623 [Leptomonas pyrrhocoris]KPA79103.1 hypothetical protein ABB37_05623 [Leptomonas pyrrhocoris]KPA79104.1 hypothetical protein ABB37_05623 [Leptomonas pyrrhocoris]|eukprot:XP_015657542.1 hypothetical protein ABB37_05623 [Leptomonas pyrrhocoris]